MAFRDLMHRSAVYFGLAEERYDDDDDRFEPRSAAARPNPEAEIEERYRERPNVRRLQSRRRRDEIDDIFGDGDDDRTNVLRSVSSGRNGGGTNRGDVRVHFVVPESFNDAQDVGNKFKESIPVILNLQGVDPGLSIRIIDFASGLTYALDGGMQKIADKTFLLTPRNVEVSAEEKARLIERGFFNQS
jgi:cell division inhibitor SepF